MLPQRILQEFLKVLFQSLRKLLTINFIVIALEFSF